ncbi:hypothetical protein CFAM422_004246 [Trichoderma lentiforme]|uniref:Uncharacterized protein n=1 Tax=Trichoderma lentiforme TaxID=1567552 RepID=A0A9P4XJN0_9HYPO|nr:hypothetical protein CFAM422_004246 [Trichoderma lentiforme]
MASTSAEMPEFSTAGTVPVLDTIPLHSQIAFRDLVRIVLLLIIPIYARIYLFSSTLNAFGQIYVISTTSICVVYFSKGKFSLHSAWDIIYGLLVSSFPSWGPSILSFIWVGPKVQGWRWEVVYWTFVARRLSYFLPEYGLDVEELIVVYPRTYPNFQRYVEIISSAIVYFALWPKGCSWHEVLLILLIIRSFIRYGYLLCLNYAQVLLNLPLAASRYSNARVAISKGLERGFIQKYGQLITKATAYASTAGIGYSTIRFGIGFDSL